MARPLNSRWYTINMSSHLPRFLLRWAASHGLSRIGENAIGIILATVAQPTSVLLLRYTTVYYITEYDRSDYHIRWVQLVYFNTTSTSFIKYVQSKNLV